MRAYYNENEPYAADWLENLIAAGHIAPGDVDRRSIVDVRPSDLAGYTQCHFFAGIGGWSLALRLAGWPDDRPVWTGSAPCPPWSRARIWHTDTAGAKDPRDLWPDFLRLIVARRPGVVLGEQVSGKRAKFWVKRAETECKRNGYDFVHRILRSADCGGPTRRERQYFSAFSLGAGVEGLVKGRGAGPVRSWRWRGETDMRVIVDTPFERGDRWPEPLLRRGDDGLSSRVGRLRAYGNAIDPWVASFFIRSACLKELFP